MDSSKDHRSSSCDCAWQDGAQNWKLANKWHQSRHPPQDNYTLDRGEEQEENVMAAGCANLQQSVWVMLSRLAALSFYMLQQRV